MSEDHCVICADSLEWTGFGPCGHKEACSRCVARLRFVLEDKRCMYCQQPQDEVYFTRYMGDYTHRPADFAALEGRVRSGEVYKLAEVGGYFDDKEHFQYIKSLCSYTHPSLAAAGAAAPAFNALDPLKRRVQEQVKLHFCDLCLKGRKVRPQLQRARRVPSGAAGPPWRPRPAAVGGAGGPLAPALRARAATLVFISEQVLYSRRDLDRHNRTGDDAGPLAEAGFKGHPPCHFCKQRFYDSGELYNHMERSHEHCFICRRAHPGKYVYFRDYAELDAHFLSDHHPCPHPACIERRFVVFQGEAELKRHFAAEHGEEMRMSRAQRREALAVPVNLQFAPRAAGGGGGGGGRGRGRGGRGGEREEPEAQLPPERQGVVIGGGAGLARGGGGGMRHSRSETAMAAAVAASVETAGAEAIRRSAAEAQAQARAREQQQQQPQMGSVSFNAADFPAVSGGGGANAPGGGVALGTWVAASGAGPSTSGGVGGSLAAEDFPELPTMSRAQKQRQKQKSKAAATSLAARMATAAAPPRVVNRATPSAASAAAAGASGSGGASLHVSRSAGDLGAAARPLTPPGNDAGEGAAAADGFPALGSGADA
ncbi:LIM domain and RING finger protein, partial [Monoraphidium neglectum]